MSQLGAIDGESMVDIFLEDALTASVFLQNAGVNFSQPAIAPSLFDYFTNSTDEYGVNLNMTLFANFTRSSSDCTVKPDTYCFNGDIMTLRVIIEVRLNAFANLCNNNNNNYNNDNNTKILIIIIIIIMGFCSVVFNL
jgi:hypothetical protein